MSSASETARTLSRPLRAILAGGGWVLTMLALAGVVLPLVPATPFALLAAVCFARSSPRAYRWLLACPALGGLIRDWHRHRSLGASTRRRLLAGAVGLTIVSLGAALAVDRTPWFSLTGGGIACLVITRLPCHTDD